MKLTLALERIKAENAFEVDQHSFPDLKRPSFDTTIGHNLNLAMTSEPPIHFSPRRLPDVVAVAAAFVFVFLAAYRIELPGVYYDELHFVNAALGAPDDTFIHMRLGSLPSIASR